MAAASLNVFCCARDGAVASPNATTVVAAIHAATVVPIRLSMHILFSEDFERSHSMSIHYRWRLTRQLLDCDCEGFSGNVEDVIQRDMLHARKNPATA